MISISLNEVFPIILYLLGSILLIVSIVLVLRVMNILRNVDELLADVNTKSRKLDGLFDLIDNTTDAVAGISDMVIGAITNAIRKIIRKSEKEGNENE